MSASAGMMSAFRANVTQSESLSELQIPEAFKLHFLELECEIFKGST